MSALVALESTVIAHGLPYPQNYETALRLESIVEAEGADARTIGIINGKIKSGLSDEEIQHLATSDKVFKVSRKDLPATVVKKRDGATTVAATMWIAHRFGIDVFATGGIGGVHRGSSFDISADLEELATTPVTVVCAGAKAILDIPATLEVLETRGVTVVGFQTDEFPAFYSRSSGLPVDVRCDTAKEVVDVILAHQNLSLSGGILVTVPIPEAHEIPRTEIEPIIDQALAEAEQAGVRASNITPFLLKRIADLTNGRSVTANLALLENNVKVAAQIACALHPARYAFA